MPQLIGQGLRPISFCDGALTLEVGRATRGDGRDGGNGEAAFHKNFASGGLTDATPREAGGV